MALAICFLIPGLVQGCIIQGGDSPESQNQSSGSAVATVSTGATVTPAESGEATAPADAQAQINTFLDAWHNAAAIADEDAYFGAMTPNGVFIGTDKNERWTRQEFIDTFRDKFFVGKEEAWTYYPKSRNVVLSSDGKVAWFDEKLWSKQDFHMRGSGTVLLQNDGSWKIAHYVMSFPVPNEVADEVLKTITDFETGKSDDSTGTGSGSESTGTESTGTESTGTGT